MPPNTSFESTPLSARNADKGSPASRAVVQLQGGNGDILLFRIDNFPRHHAEPSKGVR